MTFWTERTAGEGAPLGAPTADIIPEEPGALLLHNGIPDWIRDPTTGQQARVEGTLRWNSPCPQCQVALQVTAIVAERPDHPDQQLLVIECPRERKYLFLSRSRVASPEG